MKIMFLTMLIITLIMFMMMMMMVFISKKSIISNQKMTPFECGFNTMSYSRMPFSIHFFLIAVIFLIFDIEIILVMPIILTYKNSLMFYWTLNSVLFSMILIIGIYHEWKNGMLSWTK